MIILLDRYIKKKYSKYVFLNKNKLKKNLKTKLNLKNSYFYDYNFIKNNYESYKLNLYSTYQNNFKYFKKNFNNKKYLKLLFYQIN